MRGAGMPYNPDTRYVKADPERGRRIAEAFDAMPHEPDHPAVRAAYGAMIGETMAQYEHMKRHGFRAEFWDPEHAPDPYAGSPRLATEDIQRRNHMWVYPTRAGFGGGAISPEEAHDNPLLADSGERWNGEPVTYNDIFRATHDYFGHAKEGVGFRADGEENAWRSHAAMYSPLARRAMTNETRGQNSWVNFGPHGEHNRTAKTEDTRFAPQKIGMMPEWTAHEGAEDFLPQPRAKGGALFDLSRLAEVPNVPQRDLPRYLPPRGVSQRVQDLVGNRQVYDHMANIIEAGKWMGGKEWYNAEPLRHAFIRELGDEKGDARFRQYMDFVAATSPKSDVGTNVRNASYYYGRMARGEPMPEIGSRNPTPYGHMSQRLHQMNAARVSGAGWDPLNNPKPASFAQNLMGNQQPATIDTHAFRLPAILAEDPRFLTRQLQLKKGVTRNIAEEHKAGAVGMEEAKGRPTYWSEQPGKNEYAAMEDLYRRLAQEHGITPAQAQASAWLAGASTTGQRSGERVEGEAGAPFMTYMQDRINRTAKARSEEPHEVLGRFIRGEAPLLASGGAVAKALQIARGETLRG